MSELMVGILGTVGGAALTAILFGLVSWLRRRVRIQGPEAETIEVMAREQAVHRALVFMLTEGYRPQLLALKGILEALREKMNGSFERPYTAICGALDAYDNTLRKIAQGECEEKKEA